MNQSTIDASATLRDLAVRLPGATRVFEKLQIDYCCGGAQSLHDACQSGNLPVAEVAAALLQEAGRSAEAQPSIDWRTESLTRLTEHIVCAHHAFTKTELERIDALLDKVWRHHEKNHPELEAIQKTFGLLRLDLLPHMLKEEQVLFPYIAQLEQAANSQADPPMPFFGTVQNPVRMMMKEHDTAGDLLRDLRRASGDFTVPDDGCASYRALYQALAEFEADLHQHIHLENNLLFPAALALEERLAPNRTAAVKATCEHAFCGH